MAEKTTQKWEDKFNVLLSQKMDIEDGTKEWRFAVEESKSKGTLQLNMRKFKKSIKEGGYEGPTSSGFIESINSIEDIEKLQKFFNECFEQAKTIFK